jgi:hypothetical protein
LAVIDALVGVDYQHVFALVEAIHGADFDAVHVFAFDAIVVDDIGHMHTLNGLFASLAHYPMGPAHASFAAGHPGFR